MIAAVAKRKIIVRALWWLQDALRLSSTAPARIAAAGEPGKNIWMALRTLGVEQFSDGVVQLHYEVQRT